MSEVASAGPIEQGEGPAGRVGRWLSSDNARFGQWVAAGTLLFLTMVGFVFPAPPAILFKGAILGSLSALIAMGIVLVYRANRIINFAAGDLGAVAGVLSVSLIVGTGWGFWPATIVGLVAGVAVGGLVEFVFIRRFSKSPRLILTVATIGVAQILGFLQLIIPTWFGYNTAPQNFPMPFDFTFEWFPVIFRGAEVLVLIVVPLIAVALSLFFRFTRIGMAVRASAESSDRALLLGIPVKRIGMYVWIIAALLSAVAAILRAPVVGVPIGQTLGPTLMLNALAAAVIGRMESLTITFGAAVGIGVLEQAIFWDTRSGSKVGPVIFGILMLALIVQSRGKLTRADDKGASTWSAIKEIRPIPPELRHLPAVQWTLRLLTYVPIVLLVLYPLRLGPGRVNLIAFGVLLAILGVSLVLLTGWAGQISLGQWAFAGFGCAITLTMVRAGWNPLIALVCGAMVGAGVSMAIGIPALRIRGLFLAVATFSFALTANQFFLNSREFGYVPVGRVVRPVLLGKYDLRSEYTFYFFSLVVLGLVLLSVRSLRTSRFGRALIAVRENERGAQAYGVNVMRAKLTAFALSGFIAALAGGMFGIHQQYMLGSQLAPENSLRLFSMVVVGGLGSTAGVLIAAAVFIFIDFFVTVSSLRLLTSGVGLLLVLLLLPGGLGGLIYSVRDSLLRRMAQRRGIHVPSLVADRRVEEVGDRPPDETELFTSAHEQTSAAAAAEELERVGAGR
ncbi:MAG TPA: ABC transporter permease [Acidimicrobiales bacterium]|nr:ABC transporter permease [Acidimicrobiales bacterium]